MKYYHSNDYARCGEGDFYDENYEEYDRTSIISAKGLISELNSFKINEYVEVDEDLEFCISGQQNTIDSELSRIENCKNNEINALISKWDSIKTLFIEDSLLHNHISPIEKYKFIGYPFCWGVIKSSRKIIDACISNFQFSEEQYEHLAQEDVKEYQLNIIYEAISALKDSNRIQEHLEYFRNFLEKKRPMTDDLLGQLDAEIYWGCLMASIKNNEYSPVSEYVLNLFKCSSRANYLAILINIYNTNNEFYLPLRYNKFWHKHASDIAYIRENLSTDLLLMLQVPIAQCYRIKYGKEMPKELLEIHWDSAPQEFPEEVWAEDMGVPF